MVSRAEILSLTQKLVEIPSVTGDKEQALRCLNLVSDYLHSSNLVETTYEKNGIVSRLWGDPHSLMSPKLLLSGHIDVVKADPSQFTPRLENDNKLFGRGTGDMKGHVAAMVSAYKDWVTTSHGQGVGLLLTSDEEIGGFDGARHVVEKQGLRARTVFVPDGDFSFNIVLEQKAPHHFKIEAIGPGGHASRAFEIDNPANRLFSFYADLRKKYSIATKESPWHSTMEITKMEVGKNSSENSIPSVAWAWLSWRWPLKEFSFNEGMEDVRALCEKYDLKLVGEHGFGEGCDTDPNNSNVKAWKVTIEDTLKRPVDYSYMHGATDGRHFFKFGSNVITTSAMTSGHHSENAEWVDISSLVQLSEAISLYQKRVVED